MSAIWSGSISFGLVNIPIKLYSGAEQSAMSFTLLHKSDYSSIRYARICRVEEKEIPFKEIVKGYEIKKNEYIILTEDDFKKANLSDDRTINIVSFIDEKEIDIRFFERPYYLEPDKGAGKAYVLLREALKKSKKAALAKFIMHNRQHLALIKPVDQVLVLNSMRFLAEVREPSPLKLPNINEIKSSEVDLAISLIDQLTRSFDPKEFHDSYHEEIENIIQEKISGKITPVKGKKKPAMVKAYDIISMLKASLKKEKQKEKRKKSSTQRKKAA